MAAELAGVKKTALPKARFIGICYTEKDRENGTFGAKWGEWFATNRFQALEALGALEESEGAYAAAMRMTEGGRDMEYWIGMLFPAGTEAPEGYAYVDMAPQEYALLWIRGNEQSGEIYGETAWNLCLGALQKNGWTIKEDGWSFEIYNCPRFTTPDQDGNVILDYLIPLN
ncbi:MAG: GyrI-like domain-containing protein [Lachnospiraceae bacterium]|jgi:predicted transcriptional regulator YdeE|nr:GyrI-like domain-containing protein [Lachnospiraceae bacterium]